MSIALPAEEGESQMFGTPKQLCSRFQRRQYPRPRRQVAAFQQAGGNLTLHSEFGRDPLREEQELSEDRLRTFLQFHDPQQVFSEVIHGRYDSLCAAIAFAIDITQDLFQ